MPYQIDIHHVAPKPTAVVRLRASHSALSTVVPAACGEVWQFMRSTNEPRPGRHLAVYFDCAINLEVGVEAAQPFVGNDRVVCSTTPAGMVATTIHWGPYNRLGDAHTAIRDWCAANGHTLAGPNWEIYDHWNDDPAKVRTDVFYLLKDPAAPGGTP
jgi:effector-binding domain-containing protein